MEDVGREDMCEGHREGPFIPTRSAGSKRFAFMSSTGEGDGLKESIRSPNASDEDSLVPWSGGGKSSRSLLYMMS